MEIWGGVHYSVSRIEVHSIDTERPMKPSAPSLAVVAVSGPSGSGKGHRRQNRIFHFQLSQAPQMQLAPEEVFLSWLLRFQLLTLFRH